jgi:hypothetical protein
MHLGNPHVVRAARLSEFRPMGAYQADIPAARLPSMGRLNRVQWAQACNAPDSYVELYA